MSSTETIHTGGCFCKAVRYQVTGKPKTSVYCHCTLCQRLQGAALISTLHFSASSFSWIHSEPHDAVLDVFEVTSKPWKKRRRCKICGCTVASYNSNSEEWSVWGSQLDRDEDGKIKGWDTIKPTAHIFYETRLVDVQDDLGKWTGYENKSERIAEQR